MKNAYYIIKVSEILTPNTEEAAMSKMTVVFIFLSDCILNVDCALFIQILSADTPAEVWSPNDHFFHDQVGNKYQDD